MIISKPGDLVGIYATKLHRYRVGIFIDDTRIAILYERGKGINSELFSLVDKNCDSSSRLSQLEYKNEYTIDDIFELDYELYNLNIFTKAKEFDRAAAEYLDIIKYNLSQLDTFKVGEIIKFEGYKVFDRYVLYHHHVIYSDEERCLVIHKSGEPELKSGVVIESIVCEESLLEKASFRRISKELSYENTYTARYYYYILFILFFIFYFFSIYLESRTR